MILYVAAPKDTTTLQLLNIAWPVHAAGYRVYVQCLKETARQQKNL